MEDCEESMLDKAKMVPPPLSSSFEQPNMKDAIIKCKSRFSKCKILTGNRDYSNCRNMIIKSGS